MPLSTSALKREGVRPPLSFSCCPGDGRSSNNCLDPQEEAACEHGRAVLLDLSTMDYMWKNHWIIQLHYRKWRVEFTAQHLLTVKYLKQQLSLWTVCRPAVRMFLSNYRKNYATTSVSFQYLRSVVDNILRNLSWTLVYIWSVYIERMFQKLLKLCNLLL